MSRVRDMHDEAMRLAQLANLSRQTGELQRAEMLARQALDLESSAAELIPRDEASEPTRSILFRSAASLAFQCNDFHRAERLIASGLSGYPPEQVRQELKELYDRINFGRHLEAQGISLDYNDLQLSLAGDAVSVGMILYSEFIKRIENVKTLVDRTMQRLLNREYQRTGKVSRTYRPFIPALSTGREGSFAITLRLLQSDNLQLPLFVKTSDVINEVLTGIEFISNGEEGLLRERISLPGYYSNFLSLVRDIAPDGEKINFIGFSSYTKEVSLTRLRDNIQLSPKLDKSSTEYRQINVQGLLDFATARVRKRHAEMIGLTTDEGVEYNIVVEEGLDDIVKSYFKQVVQVKGLFDGTFIYPQNITGVE